VYDFPDFSNAIFFGRKMIVFFGRKMIVENG